MEKIISLFQRNYGGDRLVRNEIVHGAEWVVVGEGIATRKWDGTCCLVRDGKLFRRYEVKVGANPPHGFEPAGEIDKVTGKQQGWIAVGDGTQDQWHREAFDGTFPDGTFELCGPKIQGNPEGLDRHKLIFHGMDALDDAPRSFEKIKSYLAAHDIEGIVWHHQSKGMVKIKAKDFGIKRGTAPAK